MRQVAIPRVAGLSRKLGTESDTHTDHDALSLEPWPDPNLARFNNRKTAAQFNILQQQNRFAEGLPDGLLCWDTKTKTYQPRSALRRKTEYVREVRI